MPTIVTEQTASASELNALRLQTVFVEGAKPINRPISYRLRRMLGGEVFELSDRTGEVEVNVPDGRYTLRTAYGETTVEEEFVVKGAKRHVVNLNAGEVSLALLTKVGGSQIKKPIDWTVETYGRDHTGHRKQVIKATTDWVEAVLPAGWYVVEARLGQSMTKHTIEVTAGTRYNYQIVKN
jgi:hypothetical protein